jgi:hypothetical protein
LSQVPTKVARAVNGVPLKTAYAVKAIQTKMEDEQA